MLRSFKALRGFAIRATDGPIGTVSDVYFDDTNWRVRYCVVDSDQWFAKRHVLIGPRTLSVSDAARRELWVRLARVEIKRSRPAASDKPVSKQHASRIMTSLRRLGQRSAADGLDSIHDPHLRSCMAVVGHRAEAIDGRIGHVDDFLIDESWVVRKVVVSTGQSTDSRVLVVPQHVSGISWPTGTMSVDLTRAAALADALCVETPAVPGQDGSARLHERSITN